MHLEMLEWYFRSLLPQYLGDILTFWKLTVVTERRTRQLEGRCCKKKMGNGSMITLQRPQRSGYREAVWCADLFGGVSKKSKDDADTGTCWSAVGGQRWSSWSWWRQTEMETSSIIKGVLRQTMNRWLVSGVVSAAKSNLVGMDIRQPGAWGTIPTVQCNNGVLYNGVLSQLYKGYMGTSTGVHKGHKGYKGYYPNCTMYGSTLVFWDRKEEQWGW